MRRAATAALLALTLLPARADAVFLRAQLERIDPELTFDEEYFLDLLGFSYPAAWDQAWSASTSGYRVNGASLDCCSLLLQQQLRLERALTKSLTLRYQLEQYEDKDRQEFHQWLSFEQSLFAGLSAEVVGEPTFRKEDADIGLGLAYRRAGFAARARRLFVDWNFNKRNSSTQRYGRLPLTDQAEARLEAAGDVWLARLEVDHPLRLSIPAENRLFSYRRTTASLSWTRPRAAWSPSAEYAYEFEKKGNLFEPDPNAASIDFRRHVHRLGVGVAGKINDRDSLEAGQAFMLRNARSDSPIEARRGVFHRRWEIQPYARWRRLQRPWLESEVAAFLAFGEDRHVFPGRIQPSPLRALAQAKLGAGLDFLFGPAARVGVYSTLDADNPGARFWDGGNIRAMVLF